MAENNEKVVDDVHYEMSQADYDYLSGHVKQVQEILARVRVVKDDNALVAPVKSLDVPVDTAATPKPVVKEQLTGDVLKRLFGANYNNVCIYNNETGTLMTPKYNRVEVVWNNVDTVCSKNLKEMSEWTFPGFELVAQVTMQVSEENYPGDATWSHGEVKFNQNGKYIVANLIIRNEGTSKLELLRGGSWFGSTRYWNSYDAAKEGARNLASFQVWIPDCWKALFAGRVQR